MVVTYKYRKYPNSCWNQILAVLDRNSKHGSLIYIIVTMIECTKETQIEQSTNHTKSSLKMKAYNSTRIESKAEPLTSTLQKKLREIPFECWSVFFKETSFNVELCNGHPAGTFMKASTPTKWATIVSSLSKYSNECLQCKYTDLDDGYLIS